MTKPIIVKCPTCGKNVSWVNENKDRPFCSPRCKLIDLGEWASEGHRISGNEVEFDGFSNDLTETTKH